MLLVADNQTTHVQDAKAGEPAAWDSLFQRYQLPLYTYVFELIRHEQETLDIVQETFINAFRHIARLRADEKFGSWLFGIAHQKCVQHWRKQSRRNAFQEIDGEEMAEAEFASGENDPSELLLRKEQEQTLLDLLTELEPPHRSVLLLHFLEDFTLEQIAEITEAHLGTVKSRMHYAKRALKKLLEEKPL
jgi:RNA polymerase sigma-70 factor, ECF subfamily